MTDQHLSEASLEESNSDIAPQTSFPLRSIATGIAWPPNLRRDSKVNTWLAAIVSTIALVGCETLNVEEATYKDVPSDQGKIVLFTEMFGGVEPRVQVKIDGLSRYELAFYSSGDYRSEIYYYHIQPLTSARHPYRSAAEYIAWWTFFKDRSFTLGETGSAKGPMGRIPYQRFQYSEVECFSFRKPVFTRGSDKGGGGSYDRYFIGYFCNRPKEKLSEERIGSFIGGFGVRGENEPPAEIRAKYGKPLN